MSGRNFKAGYTGQQDEYGLDVPSKDLNDYYNPSGTYSLMNGGDNTLTPHLKSLMKAAWAKYKMDRAAVEKDKRNMNNIKRRHPNLIQKLNDKFRAVSNLSVSEEPGDETRVVRRNLFGNSRRLRRQRREKKTRRQRK